MINSSFLYHGFGLYNHICTRVSYKGNTIIFNVETKDRLKCCPKCGCRHLVKNGFRFRDFIGLPIGGKKTIFRMKVQRYKCKEEDCDYDQQEPIPFATGSQSYTHRFANFVVCLLKSMTIRAVSDLLMVCWDTIKDIHMHYLESHYLPMSLKNVKNIGIDEFAVRKGHVYKTIVVDLDTGRIIYVANGKDASCLDGFWKMVKRQHVTIEHIATDLSGAFIKAVMDNCPDAQHIFDHFHVQKLMNEKVDDIRRSVCRTEKDENKRNVIKGVRYLLLRNGKDVMDGYYKTRLDNALAMNEPLSKAYYLKEDLREIWMQKSKGSSGISSDEPEGLTEK